MTTLPNPSSLPRCGAPCPDGSSPGQDWARPRCPGGRGKPRPGAGAGLGSAARWVAAGGAGPQYGSWLAARLGKPALYADMLVRFVQAQSSVVAQIDAAIAAGNQGLAERFAHTLKSVAANIGAQEASEHAHALEQALRHQPAGASSAQVLPLLGALAAAMEPLVAGLQTGSISPGCVGCIISGLAAQQSPTADVLAVDDVLTQLRDLLSQDDPAAPRVLQHNATILKLPWGWVRHGPGPGSQLRFRAGTGASSEGGGVRRPARILVKLSERCISQEFQWNKRPLP